jgi:hypothetical protein
MAETFEAYLTAHYSLFTTHLLPMACGALGFGFTKA